ncbi:MAG: FGGY family carbohydrate kinase [Dermatophilaceae bacterium]
MSNTTAVTQKGGSDVVRAPVWVLAIDQGTTNTKALLIDVGSGSIGARATRRVTIDFPFPGWVEQDAAQLWGATAEAVRDCLACAPDLVPVAVAVSNQRESVAAWSRTTGAPLGPVLGWQDARTAQQCAELGPSADMVRSRTGLTLDPMFSATKMRWLLDSVVAAGVDVTDVCLGTIDAWLIWNLTGEFATEAGNASRTLLMDLRDLDWHQDLLDLFGIPLSTLPEVRASNAGFGLTRGSDGIPAGLPILAVLADSHAALFHHGCTLPGAGKATYGTGTSVMTPCSGPDAAPQGIATTIAWLTDRPTYAREGNIVASGSALDWMARMLGAGHHEPGGAYLSDLAGTVEEAGGVTFVPAFTGLGAPYWDRSAQGLLVGMTGGTQRAHLARAALEAVAHQVADVVEAIESDHGARIDVLHTDGGATASGLLMQIQADLLGRAVHVSDSTDASALGVALLASSSLGVAPRPPPIDEATSPSLRVPTMTPTDRAARRAAWAAAVARSRGREVGRP